MEVSSPLAAIRYLPVFSVPHVAGRYLANPLHCLWPKLNHKYKHADRNKLLWMVPTYTLNNYKRAPRVWTARRTRCAFANALLARNFDREGKRTGEGWGDQPEGDFKGTLTITMRKESLTEDFSTISEDLAKLLDKLFWKLKNRPEEMERVMQRRAAKREVRKERRNRDLLLSRESSTPTV